MREIDHVLVANRGEIAVRLIRAAVDLGIRSSAVYTGDDATSLHVSMADAAHLLPGSGVSGYLAGLVFVGPSPEHLELFGDKVLARAAAADAGLPVLAGSTGPATVEEAAVLLETHGAIMLKAVAGGGGRGMRAVHDLSGLASAWDRCVSEAQKAFGRGDVYVEQLVPNARHIEVQIAGDGSGAVVHLGERDCSVQRRNQKVVEIAPAPGLPPAVRDRICDAAVDLGRSVSYGNVGTVEFLVDANDPERFWFIETNARIQVEHTVTEAVTGVDLVAAQLVLAAGGSLADAGLESPPTPRGWAIQARINAETIEASGLTKPSAGTIAVMELASGPGVRVDSAGFAGLTVNANFDSLLAKLIVHRGSGTFEATTAKLQSALDECRIVGVDTNIDFLNNIIGHQSFGSATTSFVEDNLAALTEAKQRRARYATAPGVDATGLHGPSGPGTPGSAQAGARLESTDPLAVLDFGRAASGGTGDAATGAGVRGRPGGLAGGPTLPAGQVGAETPLQGTVVSLEVEEGQAVREGQLVAVVEAMKMEHEVNAPASGIIDRILAVPGDTLWADQIILVIAEGDGAGGEESEDEAIDLDEIRPSLAEVLALRARMMDEARPAAVARRRKTNQRTARENLTDLIDEGTFVEYGPMAPGHS